MKTIFSKAAITAVIVSIFALNVHAGTVHVAVADTGKMDKMDHKMDKMNHKMDKKMSKMKKKDKMMKDTTGKM